MKAKSKENTAQNKSTKPRRMCRNWTREKIDSALDSLRSNNYTLKYTSLKTGIPVHILKQSADIQRINYKDDAKEINNDHEDCSSDDEEDDEDDNENDESDEFESHSELLSLPRATTARKSTSPLKFFMRSFKISSNQRHYSSSISTSSESSSAATKNASHLSNNKSIKQQSKQNKTSSGASNDLVSPVDLKTLPLTNKIIDYIIQGPNQADTIRSKYLQNKEKILEDIEKTIKIYSYLGIRHRYHPIFLNRNLSYMHDHKKKKGSNKSSDSEINKKNLKTTRVNTKVNEILKKLQDSIPAEDNITRSFEFKWNFNFFQINNQNFIREILNEIEEEKTEQKNRKKRANVEVYGISNNQSTLLGKCRCPIKIENNNITLSNESINFMVEQNTYSYFLIRVYFKNETIMLQDIDSESHTLEESKPNANPKKRKRIGIKSSNTRKLNKTRNYFKNKNKSVSSDPSIKQHEFYSICSLSFQKKSLIPNQNLKISNPLNQFIKESSELQLEKNDQFFLKMRQLIYNRDKNQFKKYLNLNFNNQTHDEDKTETDEDFETDDLETTSEINSAKKKSKLENSFNSKKPKLDEFDLLIQGTCQNSQSFWINLTIETKTIEKVKPPQLTTTLPQFIRSSPRSKLTIQSKTEASFRNGNQNGLNSDDDIIVISPPILKRNSKSNSPGGTDKRLTRSAKTMESNHCKTNGNSQQTILIFYQFIRNEANKLDGAANGKNGKGPKTASVNQVNNKLLTYKLDFVCPFCQLDCKRLNFLCFHFQMCHFRFQIEEQTVNNNSTNGTSSNLVSQAILNNNYMLCNTDESTDKQIVHFNIRLDENFNGCYLGNPYDIHYAAHLGYSMCRVKQSKRNKVSFILVNKKSNIVDLSQFKDLTQEELSMLNIIQQQQQQLNCQMQQNNLYNCQAGIERLYYHTQTGQPIHVNELDIDSDNELDPDWLKEQTNLLIDDFDDVNEGEKDMMRLWNLHNIKFNYVPNCQFYNLCEMFIVEQTENMMKKNLFNNFILHLTNAFDYGLLTAEQMLNLNDLLHKTKDDLLLERIEKEKQAKDEKNATLMHLPSKSKSKSPSKRTSKLNSPEKINSNHKLNKSS